MARTLTSSLVNAVLAGTYVMPLIPGRVMAVTANMPAGESYRAAPSPLGR